jgi:predicted nucleic acid-binding protein
MIILDTNVISEIMRPKPEPRVMTWLRKQPLSVLGTTAVTVAEIRYGLGRMPKGQRQRQLQERFQSFLSRAFQDRIYAFDFAAAEAYSIIVVEREKAGQPVEAFDAMIAAIAQANELRVATRDVSGFEGCGVPVINPWKE